MRKTSWWQSWPRFLLWSHVISIIGFYLYLWWRTAPSKKDTVQLQLPRPARTTATASSTASDSPLVSIIVPARNEEKNIRRCIESLLGQDYEHFEIIAVDDGSTDATGRILDEIAGHHPHGNQLHVLHLDDLPEGWAGKPHAIHRGTQVANGEWLLLTDADTWHAPSALRSAVVQAVKEGADLFSLASTQQLPGFWNKVLMPMAFMGISMLYPPRQVNDPTSPVAIANGQYILIRRTVYDRIGGYARPDLQATLLDDKDLAQVVKDNGFRLRFVDGQGLVHVFMYGGLGDTWRGWRKNAFLGNRGGLPFFLLQLIGLPLVTIVPFLIPVYGHLVKNIGGEKAVTLPETVVATALEWAPLLAYRRWLNDEMGIPWPYSFTHPLAGAVFSGILAQSCWRILTGAGVDWRGRQYHNGKK